MDAACGYKSYRGPVTPRDFVLCRAPTKFEASFRPASLSRSRIVSHPVHERISSRVRDFSRGAVISGGFVFSSKSKTTVVHHGSNPVKSDKRSRKFLVRGAIREELGMLSTPPV